MEKEKKILYSGMQATGTITLGNYLGALKNWVRFHEDYESFFGVMDLHSLTTRQDPADFRKKARSLYALYVAAGLDPEKNCIYYQSHVSAHAELGWILDCFTYMGELNRMTQFKDKSAKHADNINAGLYTYPVLMAADILLYQTDVVPVGADQKQHVEICRDIAERFNNIYGDVFTIPEPVISKAGAKIMSLAEPTKKMSKSDENTNATIYLLDAYKYFKDEKYLLYATNSLNTLIDFRYKRKYVGKHGNGGGVKNCTGKTHEEIEREFDGKGYGDFKLAVGECVANELDPLHKRYEELMSDKTYLDTCIKNNDEKAAYFANKTLRKVQKKVGLTERIR